MRDQVYDLIWNLDDTRRAIICLPLGLVTYAIGWQFQWGWEVSFLCGWIVVLTPYLVLLGIVIFTANAARTRERISKVDPTQWLLLIVLTLAALLGIMSVGIIMTSVGHRSAFHIRILMTLSVIAVILSWFLLHTAFGQHYARLYYDETDRKGRPFPQGMRRGFEFPGTADPT